MVFDTCGSCWQLNASSLAAAKVGCRECGEIVNSDLERPGCLCALIGVGAAKDRSQHRCGIRRDAGRRIQSIRGNSPQYLAVNPKAGVPTLVHIGEAIYESNDIITGFTQDISSLAPKAAAWLWLAGNLLRSL